MDALRATGEAGPASWRERWLGLRNRLIADARFQRWAAKSPLTRRIARRRARDLFDLCAGFVYSQILLACVRLELFERLAAGPCAAEALAPAFGLSPEAALRLLRAAAALRLVRGVRRIRDRGDRLLRHDAGRGGPGATSSRCRSSTATCLDFGWGFLLFGPFVIVAFGNAVNLTDGLDGLAIVPVMIAAATLGMISYLAGSATFFAHYLLINHIPLAGDLMVVCGALIGAGAGFLWFNAPPAQIFMGDTGSLALGGLLGTMAVAVKHEIVLAVIGGLFVMEAVLVIVEVASFRQTGKPPSRSASRSTTTSSSSGSSKSQIVVRFWIIAFVLAMVGLVTLKLR